MSRPYYLKAIYLILRTINSNIYAPCLLTYRPVIYEVFVSNPKPVQGRSRVVETKSYKPLNALSPIAGSTRALTT